jgi:cell shape-determining protein MreC
MKITRTIVSLVLCAFGAVLFAQQPQKLSDVEQLKAENLQLKARADQMQMQQLQQDMSDLEKQYRALTDQVEKAHPGFTLSGSQLVPKTPKPEPKK